MTETVLLLVHDPREAAAIVAKLAAADIAARPVSARELAAAIADCSVGAVLITEQMLDRFGIAGVAAAVAAQPAWSDCPVLLLPHRDSDGHSDHAAVMALANVTLVERPLRAAPLVLAARAALRARARQRMAQAYIAARDAAEAQVRALAADLEASVIRRTGALLQEMTRRNQAEARLRESEDLYRTTLQLNAQVPWSTDAEGAPLSVGEGWAALTGLAFSDFLANDWHGTIHPDDWPIIANAREAARTTGLGYDIEFRISNQHGGWRWLRSRGAPHRDASGKLLRWYGIIEDVDARRTAEARFRLLQSELIHASRGSAMGAMASTLSHELGQPLTAVANYVRGSRRLLAGVAGEGVAAVRSALEAADASAVRAAEIVRRLRTLAASTEVVRRPENLAELIAEAARVALPETGARGIRCRFKFDPAAASVIADRIQIEQTLINLLRNAAAALATAPRRTITVTTRRIGSLCEIAVHDSGPGVASDVLPRLFEPFASAQSTGLGVGLAIARTIVEEHGGQIWHVAPPAGGTIIAFTLPAAPDSPA